MVAKSTVFPFVVKLPGIMYVHVCLLMDTKSYDMIDAHCTKNIGWQSQGYWIIICSNMLHKWCIMCEQNKAREKLVVEVLFSCPQFSFICYCKLFVLTPGKQEFVLIISIFVSLPIILFFWGVFKLFPSGISCKSNLWLGWEDTICCIVVKSVFGLTIQS